MAFDIETTRAKIVADLPLFSQLMFGLDTIPNPEIGTSCVNMEELQYNQAWMDKRSPSAQYVTILHELAHVFLAHPLRIRPEHVQEKIQRAADYAANDLLKDCDVELPDDALWSHKYTGMAMEDIYQLLMQEEPPPSKKDSNAPQPAGGSSKKWSKNKHGECTPSAPEEDVPGQEEKLEQALKEHERKVMESIQTAKMMGNMSSNLLRRLEKMTESKTDWKAALPDLIEDAMGMDDYTFSNPDRRYDCEFILPGMIGEKKGVIVMVGDTSGSITDDVMTSMSGEVLSVIKDAQPEKAYVIWCDSQVKGVQEFDAWEDPDLQPVGGGGTDFRPPFDYVEKNDINPTTLIYLTDGFCSRFPPEPHYPVIWLVWQDTHEFRPPFGKVVVM